MPNGSKCTNCGHKKSEHDATGRCANYSSVWEGGQVARERCACLTYTPRARRVKEAQTKERKAEIDTKRSRNYSRGRRYEYMARNLLRNRGYYVVRSAGSKGAADLIASNEHEIVYIQVGNMSKSIEDAAAKLNTIKTPDHPIARREVWRLRDDSTWEVTDIYLMGLPF